MRTEWVDPDDVSELTEEFFNHATPMIGEQVVSVAELAAEVQKIVCGESVSDKKQLTINYDADIVKTFQAMGRDWQTRMNDALRDWLNTHPQLK